MGLKPSIKVLLAGAFVVVALAILFSGLFLAYKSASFLISELSFGEPSEGVPMEGTPPPYAESFVGEPALAGQRVVFVGDRDEIDDGQSELHALDLGTGEREMVARDSSGFFGLSASADGTRVAFSDGDRVFLINPDGTGRKPLLPESTPEYLSFTEPTWSPDGRKLALVGEDTSVSDVAPRLFVLDLDGSGLRQVSDERGLYDNPEWTPDGRLVYRRQAVEDSGAVLPPVLHSSAPDGSGARPLTDGSETGSTQTAYSPGTGKVAFTSDNGGNTDLYVMNADGSERRKLTKDAAIEQNPSWSPDGTQLLFTSGGETSTDLYSIGADGTNLRRLTDTPVKEGSAVWVPRDPRSDFGDPEDDLAAPVPGVEALVRLADLVQR